MVHVHIKVMKKQAKTIPLIHWNGQHYVYGSFIYGSADNANESLIICADLKEKSERNCL